MQAAGTTCFEVASKVLLYPTVLPSLHVLIATNKSALAAPHPPAQVEANIFSRIVRVIKSYITGAVESFEDPEVMLDRITEEMQEDAARMRQVRGAQAACVKRMLYLRAI